MNAKIKSAYEFLYENAQPVIRNEAAVALGIGSDELRKEMLAHPHVSYWLDCMRRFGEKNQIHNAADTCLENWMHKLLSFGVREADDMHLAELNAGIVDYMEANRRNESFIDSVNFTIAASWLACMGHEEQIVTDVLRERVEAVHDFIRHGDYDIYASPEGYPAIPAARAVHPLVNPRLYAGNVWKLPTVHDVFAYANLPASFRRDGSLVGKIDDIIRYILDERYQRLYRGYGLMLVPPNRYYSMGWSVHLDNFFDGSNRLSMTGIVWAMELMSHFKEARKSEWFLKNLQMLEEFGRNGLYEFPHEYLSEGKDKYYVGGGHMGLGENRRNKNARLIESTAWMMRILSNMEPGNH